MKATASVSPLRIQPLMWALAMLGAGAVLAAIIWQAVTAQGVPDPERKDLSTSAMMLSSGILVFREGLEAILVLAAVTAGVVINRHAFWRSILAGVGLALAATVATWFIAIAILSSVTASQLDLQAATGLIAVIVLLVVMNWFFHKIYWTGWICNHCKRKKKLMEGHGKSLAGVSIGLALLGFTAIYREGFEVVLFLQNLRLKAGSGIVLGGAAVGLVLTGIVAALTFAAHRKLPYKKMLVLTGGLLTLVLIVMIGESAQEMQLANWLPTTELALPIPDWFGVWFAVFPTLETLGAQAIAALLVLGSYLWIRSRVPQKSEVPPPPCVTNVETEAA